MDPHISYTDLTLRLVAAAIGGALVGLERQIQDKPAGLRTNILVSVGAAGFILATVRDIPGNPDFTRVVQGIVGGIGFLGAGAIIQGRANVHGITTAAAMWVVAAIGTACGMGEFRLAGALVLACVITLYPLGYVEYRMEKQAGRDPPRDPKEEEQEEKKKDKD